MIEIKKILCPIDFSEISRHAYSYAAAIARWYQSEIVALHVVVNRPAVEAAPVPYVAVLPALSLEQVRADAMRALPEFLRAAHGGEVKFKALVVEAPDVHREIVAQAGVIRPDLVVMGSHGRTGFDRIVLGSVAEKVLRKSAVPVLIVPPHAAGTPPPAAARFHRILCATDFSTGSLEALTLAMSLAQEADAGLTLLHVIEALPELYELSIGEHMNITAIRAAVEAQSRERLQTLVPETVRTYCTVETVISEGRASAEILRLAHDRQIDLIVMGVHGRGPIDRLVFGSNTHDVIRGATCPVLTVRGRTARG